MSTKDKPKAPPRNIRVNITRFGKYEKDDIIPRYEADLHGDIKPFLENGHLSETDDPVSDHVRLAPPKTFPTETGTGADGIVEENYSLRRQVVSLEDAVKVHEGRTAAMQQQLDSHKESLSQYVGDNDRLKKQLEAERADFEAHKADMDRMAEVLKAEVAELKKPATGKKDDKPDPAKLAKLHGLSLEEAAAKIKSGELNK